MDTSRRKEIERVAQVLVDQLRGSRSCRFQSADEVFRRNVVCRVHQLLSGETDAIEPNADD